MSESGKPFEVQLTVDQDVMKELEQEIVIRKMTGSLYALMDEFILLIVKGWKDKKLKLHIETKKKGKK